MFFKTHIRWVELFDNNKFSALPELKITPFTINETAIYVSKLGGALNVFERKCPHQKADLIEGECKADGTIICPWHKYAFDLKSGKDISTAGNALKVYPTKLENNIWYFGQSVRLPFWMDP